MKTTIDIADALLLRAKRLAAKRRTTLKAVIEQSLREALDNERRSISRASVHIHTFGGNGLQAGLDWGHWSAVRDTIYEGRGS